MYITIGQVQYTHVTNISFAPSADVFGLTIPINEFSADIRTDDTITPGVYARLCDDRDNLWAKYWITDAGLITTGVIRIAAKSPLWKLEQDVLPEIVYYNQSVPTLLSDLFTRVSESYTLDSSFSSATVTGYCPQQSARDRLQWLCICIGGYVKSHFCENVQILPVASTATLIPLEQTYWRPIEKSRASISELRANAWTFESDVIDVTDDDIIDVADDWDSPYPYPWRGYSTTWRQYNAAGTGAVPSSVAILDDVTIIDADKVNDVLGRVSMYYFNPREITLDVINNGDYHPGDKVRVYADETTIVEGWIESAAFKFGLQAKATLHVVGVTDTDAVTFTIAYIWQATSQRVGAATYTMPNLAAYSIANPTIELIQSGHRYTLAPTTAYAVGAASDGYTHYVYYETESDTEIDNDTGGGGGGGSGGDGRCPRAEGVGSYLFTDLPMTFIVTAVEE